MRFFKRATDEPAEVPCPHCQVLVSVDASQCDVCGGDLRELPAQRPQAGDPSATIR